MKQEGSNTKFPTALKRRALVNSYCLDTENLAVPSGCKRKAPETCKTNRSYS